MSKYLLLAAALVITLSCGKDKPSAPPPPPTTYSVTIHNGTIRNGATVGIGDQIKVVDFLATEKIEGFQIGFYMIGAMGWSIDYSVQWKSAELISIYQNCDVYIYAPDSISIH